MSQSGKYGVSTGQRTVTVPTGGSVVFTVGTTDDSTDEADGSITATVGGGSGYRVSSSQGGATVSVADNDDGGASVLSVADGRAREGEDWLMPFTVRLSPPAAHAVEVTVSTRASKPVSARPSKPRQRQAGTTGQWIRRWCSVRGRRSGLCRFPLRR